MNKKTIILVQVFVLVTKFGLFGYRYESDVDCHHSATRATERCDWAKLRSTRRPRVFVCTHQSTASRRSEREDLVPQERSDTWLSHDRRTVPEVAQSVGENRTTSRCELYREARWVRCLTRLFNFFTPNVDSIVYLLRDRRFLVFCESLNSKTRMVVAILKLGKIVISRVLHYRQLFYLVES